MLKQFGTDTLGKRYLRKLAGWCEQHIDWDYFPLQTSVVMWSRLSASLGLLTLAVSASTQVLK
ncbi:MAG: hypothetical protein GY935_00500 [Gammaproteobacteria bacterium]|nr:hypothetical protein [Gammaproteobacteria bacterium]